MKCSRYILVGIIICLFAFGGCSMNAKQQSVTNIEKSRQNENLSESNEDKIVIEDIKNWNHPAKEAIAENGLVIRKLELLSNKTYPVFYLEGDKEKIYDYRFLSNIAEKNGYWNFKLVCSSGFVEVICDGKVKRVIMTKSDIETREYDKNDYDTAEKKAIELVVKDQKLIRHKNSDDYTPEGDTYDVKLFPYGFDEKGRFEVRVCPSDYPLSVYSYCYVDLKLDTVAVEP